VRIKIQLTHFFNSFKSMGGRMKVFVGMIAHVSLSLCQMVGLRAQNQPLGG
jgi:hypothetical protein